MTEKGCRSSVRRAAGPIAALGLAAALCWISSAWSAYTPPVYVPVVGTTAGTFAAGNDSRITGAVQAASLGAATMTPTGGTNGTLASLLSGGTPLPAISATTITINPGASQYAYSRDNSNGYLKILGNQTSNFSGYEFYINNGTLAGRLDFSGFLNPLVTTVASLTTCNSANDGLEHGVSDALSPVWNATLTGGGSSHVKVRCNGTSWVVD
jgi:hypothetical protein